MLNSASGSSIHHTWESCDFELNEAWSAPRMVHQFGSQSITATTSRVIVAIIHMPVFEGFKANRKLTRGAKLCPI